MKTYRFIKLEDYWFIDLPEYIEQGGNPGDLQMVDGADTMLDVMAEKGDSVSLTLSTEPFEAADEVVLLEICDPEIGGGYYLMKTYKGQAVDQRMWLCQVTEFVFGDLPERIFVRKEGH